MNSPSLIGLEGPLFGYFARHVGEFGREQLEACLKEQQLAGGRLCEVFRSHGLLSGEQIRRVLELEAEWVATVFRVDMEPFSFPLDTFLSVCLPAYNEAGNIGDTLDAALAVLPQFVQRLEVVVVDDGSRDATADVVERYHREDARVRLVRHEENRGYGAAVSSGLRAARGDLIFFTDADGQFSFLDIPQLLTRVVGCKVVIGYRHDRADNWLRRFNAWAWNRLVRLVLGLRVRDLDCAYKLFRREVIDGLTLTSSGAAINAEILVQCIGQDLEIRETPVSHYPRFRGAPTGAALRVIVRAFQELPQLRRYRKGLAPLPPLAPAAGPRTVVAAVESTRVIPPAPVLRSLSAPVPAPDAASEANMESDPVIEVRKH